MFDENQENKKSSKLCVEELEKEIFEAKGNVNFLESICDRMDLIPYGFLLLYYLYISPPHAKINLYVT